MICYEVARNGQRLCRAGVEEGVLVGALTWGSHPAESEKPWSLDLRVGGLTRDHHVDWVLEPLGIGDEVVFRVVDAAEADPAQDLRPEDPDRARSGDLDMSRKYYAELRRRMTELEDKWGARLQEEERDA